MKKQRQEKKLSLKKVQMIKLNSMKTINGGYAFQQGLYEGQEPTPPIRQAPSAQCDGDGTNGNK